VRMQDPKRFAELLLAEDKDWPASKVDTLWEKGVNSSVTLDEGPPVHTTYFTAIVDEKGKVATSEDLYGLDRKHARALFGDDEGFPEPPPEPEPQVASRPAPTPRGSDNGFGNSVGLLND